MASKKSQEQLVGAEIIYRAEDCYNNSLKLLHELGFPQGVLPLKDLKECEGSVRAFLRRDEHDKKVTSFLEKRGNNSFFGFLLVEMSIEETAKDKIYFKTPMGIGRSFPITAFMDEDEKEKYVQEVKV
ncbi:hypothetical protein ACS0TY_031640 [Phlomoides rotata]